MPVLLVLGDNDSIPQAHIAEFFALLGGGVKEPGWINTQRSTSRLAVIPGYSHANLLRSPAVPRIVGQFLAAPEPEIPPLAGFEAAPPLRGLWIATALPRTGLRLTAA